MKMFESFNFDIIIILILISSVLTGLYFNLYRQGRRTLITILPIILLFFSFNSIYENLIKINVINNALIKIVEVFKFKHQATAIAVIIYFLSYIILSIITRLIYSLFRVKVQKRVLNKATTTSRILCSVLGLLNGYVLGMLLLFILNPLIGLNYEKPITKVYIETANDVLTFSSLNEIKNVNTKNYENIEEVVGELTGRNALKHFEDILDVFDNLISLEEEFNSKIIPSLTASSSALIDENDLLNSLSLNINSILELEKTNPNIQRLKEINKYLIENKAYLTLYLEVNDFSFDEVSDYLLINQEMLLDSLTKNLYKDSLLEKINSFETYLEKREEYLQLINYTSSNIKEDVLYFENELAINTESIINAYKQKYANDDSELSSRLTKLFDIFLKHKDNLKNLNPKISFSVKLTLGPKYSYYFINDNLLYNNLLRVYIIDALTNVNSEGSKLYSEYIFYHKLASSIDLEELSIEEFQIILNNLNKLVTDNILSKEQAIEYFKNLFMDSNVFFGLLDDDLIAEIKTIESEYLSDELIAFIS